MHAKFLIETNQSEGSFRMGIDLKISLVSILAFFGL